VKNENKTFNKTLSYAYKLLSYRPRSKKELYDRLIRKKFNQNVITKVLNYLENIDYVNDEEFVRYWIRMRLSAKPCGVSLLYYELNDKGVSQDLIESILSEVSKDYNEKEVAVKLAKKHRSRIKNKDLNTIKRRIFNYLKRRGFSTSDIYDAIDVVVKNSEEL